MCGRNYSAFEVMNKASDAIILGIVWAISCIPLITIVPASAALYHSVVKNLRRERGNLLSTYWESFRTNLKQGILFGVLLFAYGVITANWIRFAGQFNVSTISGTIFAVVSRFFLFFGIIAQVFLCPVISRFKGNIKQMMFAIVFLSYRHVLTSFIGALLLVVCMAAVYLIPVGIIFFPVIYMYLLSLLTERHLKKYIKEQENKFLDQWYLE